MSKLPQVRSKDLLRALPHPGTLPRGTLNAILNQTQLTVEKLKKLL